MDRSKLYAALRKRGSGVFGTSLSQSQVSGIETILVEAERRKEPLNNTAYVLATTHWETASTMQPIREYGKGKGRKYGVPAGPYRHVYYGRGLVQLTWLFNYEKASKKLGFDFVKNPDAVMEPKWAVRILFEGMTEGWFTGVSFKTFIDGIDESDAEDGREYTGARKIINGTDKAAQIAAIALKYEAALRAADYGTQVKPQPAAQPIPAVAKPETPANKPSAWAAFFEAIMALFGVKK